MHSKVIIADFAFGFAFEHSFCPGGRNLYKLIFKSSNAQQAAREGEKC